MLNKGLWVDGDNRFVPPGFWSDARNAVIYNESGDYNLTNEKGYSSFSNLPLDFTPIGKINFGDGNTVLFLCYIGYDPTISPQSQIVLVDAYGNLTTIFGSDILNFSSLHQIKGTFYINNHNERVIYWTDGFNSPYYLNIDNFDASTITTEDLSIFYLTVWPEVSLGSVSDFGGTLEAGSYQATIQVLNSDFQPSNYMFVCDPISITNKPQSDANIDPAGNYDYDGAQSGFPTTKSITFSISNLGGDIAYYNLIIIQSINGVKSYFQTPNIPVSSTLVNTSYIFRDTVELVPVTEQSISQTYSTYATANTINQLNNTLLLGGLSQNIDIDYQQIANQIQVYYYTDEFNLDDDTQNYKSAINDTSGELTSTNNNSRSYMRDEVYALGIVWHFNDGTNSYAYHIPGRAMISGRDDGTVTDIIYGAGTPTWMSYNTADTEVSGNTNKLAYWQSTELYPNTVEWGSLAGTPVRHHKMPSIGKSPHYRVTRDGSGYTTERIGRILRLNITNVNLPIVLQNKIVGYSIVRVQRDQSNKSILMQGGLFNFTWRDNDETNGLPSVINSFPYSGTTTCTHTNLGVVGDIKSQFSFFSPEDRFNTVSQTIPDFMQNEYIAYCHMNGITNQADLQLYQGFDADTGSYPTDPGIVNRALICANAPINVQPTGIDIYSLPDTHAQKKRLISTIKEIQANNANETPTSIFGVSINNDGGPGFLAIDINNSTGTGPNAPLDFSNEVLNNDGIASAVQFSLVSVPSNAYFPFQPTGQGVISATGDGGYFATYYITNLKKVYSAQYPTLDTLTYMYAGSTVFLPTAASIAAYQALVSGGINSYTVLDSQGDTFIGNWYFRRSVQGDATTFVSSSGTSGLINGTKTSVKAMNYIPIESTINVALRNSGQDMNPVVSTINQSYHPKTAIYLGDGSTVLEQAATVDNFYAYNIDYSAENIATQFVPKPLNINSENLFLNRIAYSQRKSDEDVFDAYRQFLINDYKDMPREKGIIKDIWIDHNRVYIHLENTLYVIPTDELKFGTTEGTVNVGTGQFLEQTPIELKSSEDGYLGLPTAYANILTPSGYFSIDTRRCEAFLFTGEDNKISELGLRSFFLNNSNFTIVDAVKQKDPTNTIVAENGWSPNGFGYSVSFDAKYRRILIYKKDYTFVQPQNYGTAAVVGNFFFLNGYFYVWQTTQTISGPDSAVETIFIPPFGLTNIYSNLLPLDNTSYFTDNSFTLSYSLDTRSWTSFHDYQPMFMYNSLDFYSVPYITPSNANSIKLHHSNNYGLFESLKPFIVEATLNRTGNYGQYNSKSGGSPYVENALITDSTQGHKQTQCFLLDTKCSDSNGIMQPVTFDTFIAYNSYQCTGEVSITNRTRNGTASYVRGVWNINKFRDLVQDYTLPFFDNKKNLLNINPNKQYTLQKRLTDNYVVTRFIFNNTNNFKLSLYDITHIFRKILR